MGDTLKNVFASFQSGLRSATESLKAQVMNPKMLVFYTVVPLGLYLLLAPGLVLSLPPTDKVKCAQIVPLPATVFCSSGNIAKSVSASGSDFGDVGTGIYEILQEELNALCAARDKCNNITTSGTVGAWAAVVHGFLFLVLLQVSMKLAQTFLASDY
jgi:hypothetical protein